MTKDITKFRKAIKESMTPDVRSEIEQMCWRFARYSNGLSPWKLKDPVDPLVEGAIEDFAHSIKQLMDRVRIDELRNVTKLAKCKRPNCEVEHQISKVEIYFRIKELEAQLKASNERGEP